MRKILLFVLKAVVSISILWYLLSRTELTSVYSTLLSAKPVWLILSFVTLYIGKVITATRWQGLLAAQGVRIHLRTLIASVFVGQFFNSFLPTTVGGDFIRAFDTAAESKESMKSVMSVFADRLIGVFALAILAFLALITGYAGGEAVGFYIYPVLAVFLLCTFGMLLIYFDTLVVLIGRILSRIRLSKVADQLNKAYLSLHLLKDKPRVVIYALIWSFLLQINVVLFYYFIGESLNLNVSFLYFSMIVPIALIVLLVPFSINGIGIREGIFVFLLTGLNVSSKDAIALSIISFGLILTQGIIGGVIFALRGIQFRQAKAEGSLPES